MAGNTRVIVDSQALYASLKQVENGLKDMRKAFREAGKIVLSKARGSVPVHTGALKKATKLSVKITKNVTLLNVSAAKRYSKVIEFGANPMGGARAEFGQVIDASPFVGPAISSSQSDVEGILNKALDELAQRF
jgi:HK97 gp10 family phage protein